jgi:protoheme IX farnesyltransferase
VQARAQLMELWDSWRTPSERLEGVAKHIGLTKMARSYLMAVSAATAYVVRKPSLEWAALETFSYLFLLFLGAATLNNYQDRHLDGRLRRTRGRPLPRGEIGSRAALLQALILIFAGTLGLFVASGSVLLPAAGLIGVCFYNLIYTPMKKRTVLAIVPGAVCGALPILMGWMAAGGGLAAPEVWILVVIFGVWQLPHFWLVVLASREDYRESGIPNMLGVLSVRQLDKLVFVWVTSFAALTLLLPLYRVVLSEAAAWAFFANALVLTSVFGVLLFSQRGGHRYRNLFRYLSLSVAVVMCVIIVDGIAWR